MHGLRVDLTDDVCPVNGSRGKGRGRYYSEFSCVQGVFAQSSQVARC